MGYHLSRASRFHLVNKDLLRCELAVRHLQCEVPQCEARAVDMFLSRIPLLVCGDHMIVGGTQLQKLLEQSFATLVKYHREVTKAAAFEHSGDDTVVISVGEGDIMEQIARAVGSVDRTIKAPPRVNKTSVEVWSGKSYAFPLPPLVPPAPDSRPPLATLVRSNSNEVADDPFE